MKEKKLHVNLILDPRGKKKRVGEEKHMQRVLIIMKGKVGKLRDLLGRWLARVLKEGLLL